MNLTCPRCGGYVCVDHEYDGAWMYCSNTLACGAQWNCDGTEMTAEQKGTEPAPNRYRTDVLLGPYEPIAVIENGAVHVVP